ncbi:helix-turn-helix domain-containing protein [Agromyces humatus]|nr:LysR family transcriptional regulator [Agromyces humatus]
MSRQLDLKAACEVFVAVAERESFTAGAAGAGVTQSVASRRIAALEEHLGARLFDRSSRRVELTEFGHGVLPTAIKLVTAAHQLSDDAGRALLLPVGFGVPHHIDESAAARLCAAAAARSMTVELAPGRPAERAEAFSAGRIRLVLEHVEPDRARWSSPLGVGSARAGHTDAPFFFAELRQKRGAVRTRRLWLQPEDEVPHVRDRLERVRNGAGLVPGQLRIAPSIITAMAEAIGGGDRVLCTRAEADGFGLGWRPLGDLRLVRGYALASRDGDLAARFTEATGAHLAALLRATENVPPLTTRARKARFAHAG